MKKEIKILHILSGVGGGVSTWVRKAAQYSNGKYKIDVMAFSISNKSSFRVIVEAKGGKCFEMPRVRVGIISLVKYISSIINKGGYDLIHCHIDGYEAVLFWFASTVVCKKPIIIHSHRTSIEKIATKKYEKILCSINRYVNCLIAKNRVSCGEKAACFAYGNCNNVMMLHNGIDPIKRSKVFIDSNEKRINILALGRLNRVKNHDFMIRIANELMNMGRDFHLFIVGDGERKGDIVRRIRELNLSRYISLEGYRDDVSKFLNKCDILLMPSFSEGLPTVMLEAQAYGCKVIASDRITKECDLGLGMVAFRGIEEKDLKIWAQDIINYGKKRINFDVNELNTALLKRGFINEEIYDDYFKYIINIVER